MNSVFMNNFRGFSKAVLPVRKANFFVGENSTGKTSVIALLDLLTQIDFWYNLDFNIGSYEFGGYDDIVSAFSLDQTEFQIGVCKLESVDSREDSCHMLHFRRAIDGLPKLVRYSYLSRDLYATIRVSKNQISAYFERKNVPPLIEQGSDYDCFNFLLSIPNEITAGYRIVDKAITPYVRKAPIASFPAVVLRFFDEKDREPDLMSLPFPGLPLSLASMAPIRTRPKRTYDGYTKRFSPDGEHTPYVIRTKLPRGRSTNNFKKGLDEFGRESGLFKRVEVAEFGRDSASPFELRITLQSKALRINSVGYGVSQVLPVVVELLTHGRDSCLAIQQPEVHLHPKAQAALGDVLFHAVVNESQTLFVETHSDYLLDRFRLNMREHEHPQDLAQLVFFERKEDKNLFFPMEIESTGDYPVEQPTGFREFFLTEQRRLLGV